MVDAQTRMQERLGPPVATVYRPRPEILVTLSNDRNGGACKVVVRLEQSPLLRGKLAFESADPVVKIVDDLIPASERGKVLKSGFFDVGHPLETERTRSTGSYYFYENVRISYSVYENYIESATIRWNDNVCNDEVLEVEKTQSTTAPSHQ